jgi:ATP-dependent RNA helicase DeaD
MTLFVTSPMLAKALAQRNYVDATPVQSAVLTAEATERDLLVSAQTGSGKTVAYGLAIAPTLMDGKERFGQAKAPLALIIAPTRELALQVERELEWLFEFTGARIVSCVGGMDARVERRKLADGVHIVVGTPGRLRDHIERGGLNVADLKAVVLDEADEMLDLGFREDLEFILKTTPHERQTLMFSATMPKAIAALAKRYQRDALRIEVTGGQSGHADIEYRAIRVLPKETELAVVNLLRFVEAQTAIVFCNTREAVRHLQAMLLERGFSTVLLSGELSQHERNQSMQALRDGRARVCVATDVAARGIDLPNLGLVVHADIPHDAETLQHRSGRTGRAGRKGVSALLVPPARRRRTEFLLRDANVDAIWSGPPTAEDIRKLDQERLLQDPLITQEPSDEDIEMSRALVANRTPEQLAATLVKIYRSRLPAIEDVVDPGNGPERREPRASAPGRPAGFQDRSGTARNEGPREFQRGPKPSRTGLPGGSVWFWLDIGRNKNADPKWILPMLCRKGDITKQDIGSIRIFDNETRFEVAEAVASQFTVNMKRPGGDNIRIERLGEGAQNAGGEAAPRNPAPKRPKPKYVSKADRGFKPKG